MGMNSDHCSQGEESCSIVAEKKTEAVQQMLGEEAVLEMDGVDVDAAFECGQENMIKQAGGQRSMGSATPESVT